ncbi:MAG: Rieske 2Fe-2S domain-containing protein [Gammaproteobacteria bacterium]|nr:Rieske 2Fe-2S domain-containing protein [Gammaproteobacteria bacterium]
MADVETRRICDREAIRNGGDGVRFYVLRGRQKLPAFVIRHEDVAYAYLNQCAHTPVELDWEHGQFFDKNKRYLICATHGALYEPATGACVDGPCRKKGLVALEVDEREDGVFIVGTDQLCFD